MRLDEFLKEMIEAKASDVFIVAGLPIAYRVGGRQQRIDGPALMPQDTEAMVRHLRGRRPLGRALPGARQP